MRRPTAANRWSCSFETFTHPTFNPLEEAFYKPTIGGRRVKVIPEGAAHWFDPVAFAFAIAGDGSLSKKRVLTLSLHSFAWAAQEDFVAAVNARYGLAGRIYADRAAGRVAFPARDLVTIRAIVTPHLVPTVAYKVGTPAAHGVDTWQRVLPAAYRDVYATPAWDHEVARERPDRVCRLVDESMRLRRARRGFESLQTRNRLW